MFNREVPKQRSIMIAILDYGGEISELYDRLVELQAQPRVTNREFDILQAEKIILPDTNDLNASIRKLHLLNLFSILRMVKKPMLGIGSAVKLMCEFTNGTNQAGLGMYDVHITSKDFGERSGMLKVAEQRKSVILQNVSEGTDFFFRDIFNADVTAKTAAVLACEEQVTVAFEKDNFYGVQFLPEKSEEAGRTVLENFVNLRTQS